MGSVQRETVNEALMNIARYDNLNHLRHLIKNYDSIHQIAAQGDSVAIAIYIDLKTCIDSGTILTPRQKYSIISVDIHQHTLEDTAQQLRVTAEMVRQYIDGGIKRISKALVTGAAYWGDVNVEETGPSDGVPEETRPDVQAERPQKSNVTSIPERDSGELQDTP